ncbi:MAG: hypothetical protein ACRYF0_01455 [Janthinobacterium lividum]
MKPLLLVLSLLLLALLVPPAGHGAHHRHCATRHCPPAAALRLAPPRVVRSPAVARQHRLVRAVQ